MRESWMHWMPGSEGIERASAFFRGVSFSPHRHDSYAIGYTTRGVQAFDYRGESRASSVGDVFVLHPDERHDGRQGTDEGYGYRIVYLEPALIAEALSDRSLPFIAGAVTDDGRLRTAVHELFPDRAERDDTLYCSGALTGLADALLAEAGGRCERVISLDHARLRRVREHLLASLPQGVSMTELEQAHGMDRFALARQFRAAFGISPHRFLILRRLDLAKRRILEGQSLAEAALSAGFADQSHMTRRFRQAYGLSPGRWRLLLQRQSA